LLSRLAELRRRCNIVVIRAGYRHGTGRVVATGIAQPASETWGDDDVEMTREELPGGITKVILSGSLDIAGAQAIDLKMNVVAGSSRKVIVDLEKVTFIGSMGLRSLILPARALASKGGKMVMFGPTALVADTLKTSGLDTVVPVYHDYQAALDALHALDAPQ